MSKDSKNTSIADSTEINEIMQSGSAESLGDLQAEFSKTRQQLTQFEAIANSAPVNIMLANTDREIIYMNPQSEQTLRGIEHLLPCKASECVGQVIDIFHKNAPRVAKILADPANLPHQAVIGVGDERLQLRADATYDADGTYAGPVVTWELITEQLRTEREMARVNSMMENAPTNILFADLDLNIRFQNPASQKTLETLEHLLPCKANEVVGQSVDIFHKKPELQRRILTDPSNLPHRANIHLGDDTLDLLVSPIFDNQGNYMGPMVTWEVITEKLRQEKEIADAAERERVAAQELQDKVDQILGVVTAATEGDLTRMVTVSGSDAIGQLGEGLATFLTNLAGSIGSIGSNAGALAASAEELTAVSETMGTAASDTSNKATVVSAAAEQVNQNVQTVATATQELDASVKEIAKNATEAAHVGSEAVKVAEATNITISKLGDSSAEVGQVIKVITSIAQQTNLLALNATIEAARAGEAGKGFAVVANEVKELAKETAKATEDISRKIEAIQTDTNGAVQAIGEISGIINRINDIQTAIASSVEEQTATTNEITRNITEAARGSGEIAENISDVAMTAENSTSGAADTKNSADELSRMANELQSLTARFKYE